MDWTETIRAQVDAAIELEMPEFIVDPLALDHVVAARNAYKKASVNGGVVRFKPGVQYEFNNSSTQTGFLIASDNARTRPKVQINGAGAKIRLSANTPRFADPGAAAGQTTPQDYDVQRNHDFVDLEIDGNNVGGRHHVLYGAYTNGGTISRLNFEDLSFRRITLRNVLSDPTPTAGTPTNHRLGLWVLSQHAAAGEATQTNVLRITIEDYHQEGGNAGAFVGGGCPASNTAGANVFVDDWRFERCWHNVGSVPTGFFASSNFHVVSRGFGGRGVMRDIYGENSGDVGLEHDAGTDCLIERAYIKNPWTCATYHRNFNNPQSFTAQKHRIKGLTVEITDSALAANGIKPATGDGTNEMALPFGDLIVEDFTYHRNAATIPVSGFGSAVSVTTPTQLRKLSINGATIDYEGISVSSGANVLQPINVVPVTTTLDFRMRDVDVSIAGAATGGTNGVDVLNLSGLCKHDLEYTYSVDISGMAASTTRGCQYGTGSGSVLEGRIKMRVRSMTGDSAPRGIVVRGTGTLSIPSLLRLDDCDWSGMSAGTAVLFATGVENKNKVLVTRSTPRPAGVGDGSIEATSATGGAIVAAATLPVPLQAEYVPVSGNTGITNIDALPAGRRITLVFSGTPTVTDGGNLKLAGNFVATADDSLSLVSDGTNWIETGRSVN